MRRFADQRLRLIVLSLAIAGSFGVRAFVHANWEGQPLPLGLSGATFYATTTVFIPSTVSTAGKHIVWAAGRNSQGNPLIIENQGTGWTVVFQPTQVGENTEVDDMPFRTISAWVSPGGNSLNGKNVNLIAAGDRGLLVYGYGVPSVWQFQLEAVNTNGSPCTDDLAYSADNQRVRLAQYFDLLRCTPWVDVDTTLRASGITTLPNFNKETNANEEKDDRRIFVAGNQTDDLNNNDPLVKTSAFLFTNSKTTTYPNLGWTTSGKPTSQLQAVVDKLKASGNPDIVGMSLNRFSGWMVGANPGRLFRVTREDTGFPIIEDVIPAGLSFKPTGVAFIEERSVDATSNKLPSHIWITSADGKVYRYEYPAGTIIADVDGPLGGRTITNFNGVTAVGETLGGNLIFNPTYVDGPFRYWRTTQNSSLLKSSGDSDEDNSAGSPLKRLKLQWEHNSTGIVFEKRLRVDAFKFDPLIFDPLIGPTIPQHASATSAEGPDLNNIPYENTVDSVDESKNLRNKLTVVTGGVNGGGSSSNVALRVSGFLRVPVGDGYRFRIKHTNGVRFFLGETSHLETPNGMNLAKSQFTTAPMIDDWGANNGIETTVSSSVDLLRDGVQLESGLNSGFYPFVLEWWNGDNNGTACDSAYVNNPNIPNIQNICPQLSLEWDRTGPNGEEFTQIPVYNKDNDSAGGLMNLGNYGAATAQQIIEQPILPGQSFRIKAKYKVKFDEPVFQLALRDPRHPVRGWAGFQSYFIGGEGVVLIGGVAGEGVVPSLWSGVNQSPGAVGPQPKAPIEWQTLDYIMTNTSNITSRGIVVQCLADYGTTAWCGGISVEPVGGITGASRQHVWAVGPGGVLAARHSTDATDGKWALEDTPRMTNFNGVAGDSAQHLWVVGDQDTLLRYTGGNVKGWAWVGSDTGDQTDTSGRTATNDAVGWISFNCANTSTINSNGTCNNSPFNYGVHLNGPALCDANKCSNNPDPLTNYCTTNSDCGSEVDDGIITGHAWFGVTDPKQTASIGNLEPRRAGYCDGEAASGLTADPNGHGQRCAVPTDCLIGVCDAGNKCSNNPSKSCNTSSDCTDICKADPASTDNRLTQCSANPSFPRTALDTCEPISCALNPSACRAIGWLSFERSETGNPPSSGDDFHCDATTNTCGGTQTQIDCSRNGDADCPLAKFDNITGKIQGWGRFLTLKDAKNTGWVHLGSENRSCPAPITGNPICQPGPDSYNLCRDCKVNDHGTLNDFTDDTQTCSLCNAAVAQPSTIPSEPGVKVGDLCTQCGASTSQAESCSGICQNKFLQDVAGPLPYCSSNDQCVLPGDRCVGFGSCSSSGATCIANGDCSQTPTVQTCQNVAKVCPVCQTCQRWTTALDQSNGKVLGWSWSEDFGWIDMSNIRIGNVAWLQTKFGDVYSAKDIGSQSQPPPPSGESNATYLVLAGGTITNFTSALEPILNTSLPIYENALKIPLAQKDKANILGRLDYSNIIADRECRKISGVTVSSCTNGKDHIPDFRCKISHFENTLCFAGDALNSDCPAVDTNCGEFVEGKYGRVTSTDDLGPSNIDLGGKVYFKSGAYTLDTHQIIVGEKNGSGLIVVDGNLIVNGDITYGSGATLTEDRQLPSLGVLVTGDMTIDAKVSQLHGTFYVLGKVTVQTSGTASLDQQLHVYGAMVAHEFDFQRQFLGTLDQPEAAEVIQYDGRLTANPPPGFQDLSKALPDLKAVTP